MQPYKYPDSEHTRRHGPHGYTDYERFREWIRDEFLFRCIYCLHREKWTRPRGPGGADGRAVDKNRWAADGVDCGRLTQ